MRQLLLLYPSLCQSVVRKSRCGPAQTCLFDCLVEDLISLFKWKTLVILSIFLFKSHWCWSPWFDHFVLIALVNLVLIALILIPWITFVFVHFDFDYIDFDHFDFNHFDFDHFLLDAYIWITLILIIYIFINLIILDFLLIT